MIEDAIELAWCRFIYFDQTSNRAQVKAAWIAAEAIVAKYQTGCW